MRNPRKRAVGAVCVLALAVMPALAPAASTNAAPAAGEARLSARLDAVRQQAQVAKVELQKATEEMNRFRREACATNDVLAAMQKEVLQLEKVLADKRRLLGEALEKTPGMQAVTERYDSAYKKLQALREQERDLAERVRVRRAVR